jgi:putative ABC transport system permease protein
VLSVYYNKAILYGLNSVWQDAVRTHDLSIHISFGSLLVGLFSGILIAVMAVFFLIRKEIRSKNIQTDHPGQISGKAKLIQGVIAICLLILSIGPVILAVKNGSYDNSALFMASGAFMILFMILFVRLFILKNRNENSMGVRSIPGIWQLAFRNISRKSKRSLVAISMLALGTFSVCITGANRQTYFNDESNRSSGTGGFLYWLESSIAFQTDPNTKEGQASLNISEESILDSIHFVPLLTLQGDDASCLNLNQVTNPQILGVDPTYFDSIKAFSFAGLTGEIDKKAPWLELEHQYDEHTIPAYIDQTVITWGLMKKLGDTLIYLDESGSELNLIIAGGLNNSIFQGNVLIDENKLRKYFPSTRGAKVLLIEGKEDNRTGIENLIDYYFQDFGVEFQRTSVRMMAFNSVSNTYLNVFMLLGALGLLIGTLGFGIILLRNKAERKSELALMQAIGIPEKSIYFMEVMENVILLGIGLGIGLAGTIIGLLPSLISKSASAPIGYMILIILAIFINGLFWILVLGRNSKQKQLPAILRAE